jgi:tripartite-type tricarboxylate transporter receptor subunit TctC
MRWMKSTPGVVVGVLLVSTAPATAASLTCRTIEIVVPYSAGAFVDALGRMFAARLAKALDKPAIVINRPGGGTIPGTISVVNANPDGCTILLVGGATLTTNPTLRKGKLPYDTLKDLAPISVLASSPAMMMATPALGVDTLSALIELAKRKPGAINYASPGLGSNPHLAMEYFKLKAGVNFVHVTYRGLAPATTDLVANHVQLLFSSPAGFEDLVKSGRLKALGVTGSIRLKELPDVPLLSEVGHGMPDLDNSSIFGLLTSSRVPNDTISMLANVVKETVGDSQFASDVERIGLQPVANSPAAFREVIVQEIERWADLITRAGIQVD